MGKKDITICSWKKSDYTAENMLKVVDEPRFYCQHCGRVSKKKKYLCEPDRLFPKK